LTLRNSPSIFPSVKKCLTNKSVWGLYSKGKILPHFENMSHQNASHFQRPSNGNKAESQTIPYKWKALLSVAVGMLMATMDASITNIAFPVMSRVFEAELSTIIWVSVAYILTSTSTLLILGKISDVIGRKRIYILGVALFTVGMAACSVATGIGDLIFYRCIQGLGAAMTISCGTAIVAEAFPTEETGKGLGMLGVAVSLGFIVGPVLGGFLLDWLDWRSIFYARIPIALFSVGLAVFLLHSDKAATSGARLDWIGAITSSAGIFCLVYGVGIIEEWGLFSLLAGGLVVSGFILLVLFALVEQNTADPIVDLSLFKNATFRHASSGLLFNFIAAPPFILIMPFYLMGGLRLSPSKTGLLLSLGSIVTMVSGPISGSLSDRFGAPWFAIAGASAITASFAFMLFFSLDTPIGIIALVLMLLGAGIGMFQAPNNSQIMGSAPRNRLGIASALIATLRQVGLSLGMAAAGSLYSLRIATHREAWMKKGLADSEAARHAIPFAFHDALIFSITLSLFAVVFSLLCLHSRRGK
jgi:EmrB/QacA subfamily drug resistance transporter